VGAQREGRDELLAALNWEARRTAAFMGLLTRAVAAQLAINPTDVETVGLLSVTGPVTAGRLAELTGLSTGTITLVIDRLERSGFARRVPDSKDRRRVLVELVPGRTREAAKLFAPVLAAGAGQAASYDDRDLALIVDYLRKSNDQIKDTAADLMRDR
jgi:DNA-binding MarR family transcriptional regulator